MNKWKIFHIIKNNFYVLWFVFKRIPIRVVYDCFKSILGSIFYFFEHTYSYMFIIDCIQYKRPFYYVLLYMLFLFIFGFVINRFANFYSIYYKEKDEQKIVHALHLDLFEQMGKIDLANYDKSEFFDDYFWNIKDASKKFFETYESIISIFSNMVIMLFYGGFVISLDGFGLILFCITIIIQCVLIVINNKINYQEVLDLHNSSRVKDYVKRIFYMQDYASELRMNNIKTKLFELNNKAYVDAKNIRKRNAYKLVIIDFIKTFVLDNLAFDVIYILYLSYKATILGVISYGAMIALIRTQWGFAGSISGLVDELLKLHNNSLYVDKIKSFLQMKSGLNTGNQMIDNENIESLELVNVSFSYENGKNILNNINMKINKNEKIAIVGHNGAGKTTLVNVLLRLYDVSSGDILVNDKPIKTIDIDNYRSHFSIMFQDFYLYATSIQENIALDVNVDENALKKALSDSGMDKKIYDFPQGAHSQVTKEFDDEGVSFSKGEIQKLMLARLIYSNREVLIMDEPSASLDPISEARLNDMIVDFSKDKMVIFISHRLSSTKFADRIYYLENGEIKEFGSHTELMELNGKYAEMFNIQSIRYKEE